MPKERGVKSARSSRRADTAFAILLAGDEMGFAPMASARSISLVKGKVSLNADAQIGLCKRSQACKFFKLVESTAEQATYVTHREGDDAPTSLTYTIADATRATLTGSSTWRAHPKSMLGARAGSALAKAVYPDVVAGIYDPDEAEAMHERLLGYEKQFLTSLEVPFRVIDVAAGDLGLSAARKFDCEGWIPTQGAYREITSTSNCTEFQARRLDIRLRDADGTRPLATLNGTLCAMTRTIILLLENHQQPDGSVRVPSALRPYLGGREFLTPA